MWSKFISICRATTLYWRVRLRFNPDSHWTTNWEVSDLTASASGDRHWPIFSHGFSTFFPSSKGQMYHSWVLWTHHNPSLNSGYIASSVNLEVLEIPLRWWIIRLYLLIFFISEKIKLNVNFNIHTQSYYIAVRTKQSSYII